MPEATTVVIPEAVPVAHPSAETIVPDPTAQLGSDTPFMRKFAKIMEGADPTPEKPEAAKAEEKPVEKPAAVASKPEEKAAPEPNALETSKGMGPKTAEKFDHIKASREEWRGKAEAVVKERDTLQSEIAKLREEVGKKPPIDTTGLEALQKERDELSERLRVADVQNHPKFKAFWDTQINSAIDGAKSIVGATLAPKLEAILSMPDSDTRNEQLEALAEGLSGVKQGALGAAVSALNKARSERASELQKSAKDWETIQAREREQTEGKTSAEKARIKAAREQEFGVAMAQGKKLEAFKPADGDTAHAAAAKEYEGFVKAYFDGTLDPKIRPTVPVLAAAYLDANNRVIPALRAEIAKLTKSVQDLTKAAPNAGGGSGNRGGAPATPKTAQDVFNEQMGWGKK